MAEEKNLERGLYKAVKDFGGIALKIWCVSFTGFPDRMVLIPGGKVSFAEIKTTGKKPTPRQLLVHTMLRKLGFTVWAIDTDESLADFLKTELK